MLTISNVKVYDLEESLVASGNAMRLIPAEIIPEEVSKGIDRAIRLNQAAKSEVRCHNHFLCGIRVSFNVIYPQYWSMEAQRYHWLDIVTSSSKMHRLSHMDIRKACNKYVDPRLIKIEQEKVNTYNLIKDEKEPFVLTPDWLEDHNNRLYRAFMEMISNCPMGLELFMRVSTNYLELQNIYFQRRHHKLKEDWGPFCEMIEHLPRFKELILGESE